MQKVIIALFVVLLVGVGAYAANLRPGLDPPLNTVIWADPFDWYTQFNWDNRANATYQPQGTLWVGGPIIGGAADGQLPTKSSDGSSCGPEQTLPGLSEMARAQWINNDCAWGTSVRGIDYESGSIRAMRDAHCGGSGEWVETKGSFAYLDYCWGTGGWFSSMPQFTHDMSDRISAYATKFGLSGPRNAINGSDANPLVLMYYMAPNATGIGADINANMYVELSFGDDKAPTDYIWRGKYADPYPATEACGGGPYPIVCQQAREINQSASEDGSDLIYVNTHCPPLSNQTWRSIAFGYMAIVDKDPCGSAEQGVDSHIPTADHPAVFDGNKWRQIRTARYAGFVDPGPVWGVSPGWPAYDLSMNPNLSAPSTNFTLDGKTLVVYVKIVTDYILIYAHNSNGEAYATVPRVYKGGFNKVRLGVGPGSQLVGVVGGNWTDSTKTLTRLNADNVNSPDAGAFTNYTWTAGDTIELTSGTGVTLGTYAIASKTNNDSIVLSADINGASGDITDDTIYGVITKPADCLRYSAFSPEGYARTKIDSMLIYTPGDFAANLTYEDVVNGACCNPQTQTCARTRDRKSVV